MDHQESQPDTPHHGAQLQDSLEFWPSSRTNFAFFPEDFPFQGTAGDQQWFPTSTKVPGSNTTFMPPQGAYPPLQQPSIAKRNTIQQVRSQAGTPRPSTKRQKIEPRILMNEQHHIERCLSQSGAESTCCSSCPDSPPCVEPDCSLVVPCTDKSCAVPVCTDPCLDIGNQAILDQTRRLTNWENSVWTPQSPRAPSQDGENIGTVIDPSLGGFDRIEYPHGESPYSNAPSMVLNDVPTPYSPRTSHATPQSAIYQSQQTYDNDILSGAGAMFHPSTTAFNGQSFGSAPNKNSSFTFSCRWDGCDRTTFPSLDDWLPHLHKEHLDPQLTFHCPVPEENCPIDIEYNGLFGHLEDTHGYNFMNENSFSCPAPDCDPAETYCDPSLLHNHFDYVHATPTKGTLQCRVDSCNTGFADPGQLSCHLNDVHNLPVSLPTSQDIDLTLPRTVPKDTPTLRQSNLPSNDSFSTTQPGNGAPDQPLAHTCKWIYSFGLCGRICNSEAELQTHVTNDHLNSLDKGTGYNCHWQGCGRHSKRGEKSGFSQRGKLERHMATHTGCK